MKVGVSTATFFTKLVTEDSFSVIKRCGGEVAEVFLTTFSEYEPSFARLLKERKEEAGLDIYSVHALNTEFEPQLFNAAERTRTDAERVYLKVLSAGREIGARYYTFHGTSRLKKSTVLDPERVGRRMRELGDMALDHGITLCFENVHWAAFNEPSFFEGVKQFAPNIGAVLDIKQARQSGHDWREYVSVMGGRLKNVHISDHIGEEIVMCGKGEFDFCALADTLAQIGYDGPLIIEQYAKNYGCFDEVAQSVDYIKRTIRRNI